MSTNLMSFDVDVTNQQLQVVSNYDLFYAELSKKCDDFKNIVVTESNLKDCKGFLSELVGMRTALDKKRKEVKKILEAPVKDMDGKFKNLIALVTETEGPLADNIEVFDNKRRDEKRKEAEAVIKKTIEDVGLNTKYAATIIVKDSYLNLSGTKKAVKEAILKECLSAKEKQDKELADKETIKMMVDKENATIIYQMDPESFIKMYDKGDPVDEILKEVISRAESYRMTEAAAKKAKEDALAEIKEKEDSTTGVDILPQQTQDLAAPDPALQNTNIPSIDVPGIPSIDDLLNGLKDIGFNSMNADQAQSEEKVPATDKWEVTFKVTGPTDELSALCQHLKDKKINYSVISQIKLN